MARLKMIVPEIATQEDKAIIKKNEHSSAKKRKEARELRKKMNAEKKQNQIDPIAIRSGKLDFIKNIDLFKFSKEACEQRLINFIKEAWHIVEPRREFVNGWVIGAVAEHLEAVSRGYISDLLINVPPGCMKSLSSSVFWPTWEWGPMNSPSLRHINFSYSPSLTIRDNRKARNIIRSDWYQKRWGNNFNIVGDQNAKIKFENDKTGWMLATSIGGVGTGERADRTKLDDPHNVQDGESDTVRQGTVQWFRETLSTRVNNVLKSHFIVIMQRVHEEDVSGEIIAEEFGYTHLMIPMRHDGERHCRTIYIPNSWQCQRTKAPWEDPRIGITIKPTKEDKEAGLVGEELIEAIYGVPKIAEGEGALAFPELFPLEAVEKLENKLGEYATAAQLDQQPGPRKGGMFKREKFQIIASLPAIQGTYVRGWDFAGTKAVGNVSQRQAASASTLLFLTTDKRVIIVDSTEHFWSPGELEQGLVNIASQDGEEVWISMPQDPGQAGKHQAEAFGKKLGGYRFEFTPETGDKVTRATPLASQVEINNVFLVKGDWNKTFLDRMAMFPNGRMDITDASSRAYAKALSLTSRKPNARLTGDTPISHGGTSGNFQQSQDTGISQIITQTQRLTGSSPLGGVNSR